MNILTLFFIKQCIVRALVLIREGISTITNMKVWVYGNYCFLSNWIFSSVYPHMQYKVKFIWGSFITLTAFIWFLCSVCHHMWLETIISQQSSNTLTASIRFLFSVFHQMCLKTTISQKRFNTQFALIPFLTSFSLKF